MLQLLFRNRSNKNAHRFLSVLKQCWRSIESESYDKIELRRRSHEIERYREQKKYKKNFLENLFLGLIEPEVFEYPQIRTKIELDYLKEHSERADNLIIHGMNDTKIESAEKITKKTFGRLQEADLIGMKIKLNEEGLGYFESESSFIQESLLMNSSLGKALAENENSGYQILQFFGTESQKLEYLPKFIKGECVASLAHLEDEPWIAQDSSPINTTAVQEEDGSYVISGRKKLVYNPNCADILMVSARVDNSKDNNSYTLFMVDKNSLGLSVLVPFNKHSLKGTEMCDVILDKVIVSQDRVVGQVNQGSEIINKLISKGKFSNGAFCIGIMRKLVNDALNYCIHNIHFNKPLYKFKYVQGKIGEIIHALYAAESMTYLMNGRIDQDPDLDAKLESVIVKIFNSEALNFVLYNYMHLVGRDKCNEKFISTLIEDALFFNAFDDPNIYLKMTLAQSGLKYTMKEMSNRTIKEYKPKSQMKLKLLKWEFTEYTNTELQGYLHLALADEADIVEHCLQMLNFLTELLISTYGNEILNKPHYLTELSELVILIYKMIAVLGRSSRSYCIGLRHSDKDIRIARNICQNAYQRTQTIHRSIMKNLKNEPSYKKAPDYVSVCKKFFPLRFYEPVEKKVAAS